MNPSPKPRTLVISSCTGQKTVDTPQPLTLQDLRDPKSPNRFRLEQLDLRRPATELYAGMQHLLVKDALNLMRQHRPVDFHIVSAGYGVVHEDQPLLPYEATFNHMSPSELRSWSLHLAIPATFQRVVAAYDLVWVLLGEKYLQALQLPLVTSQAQSFIFFCSRSGAKRIDVGNAKCCTVELGNHQAKRFGYGLVGLKGYLLKRVASLLQEHPDLLQQLWEDPSCIKLHLSYED